MRAEDKIILKILHCLEKTKMDYTFVIVFSLIALII